MLLSLRMMEVLSREASVVRVLDNVIAEQGGHGHHAWEGEETG